MTFNWIGFIMFLEIEQNQKKGLEESFPQCIIRHNENTEGGPHPQ